VGDLGVFRELQEVADEIPTVGAAQRAAKGCRPARQPGNIIAGMPALTFSKQRYSKFGAIETEDWFPSGKDCFDASWL